MMASKFRTTPLPFDRRRSSDGLMDTAEDLVDKLDSLADILEELEEKYSKVSMIYIFCLIRILLYFVVCITGKKLKM